MSTRVCTFFVLALGVTATFVRADLADDIKAVLRDKYLGKEDVGVADARLDPQAGTSDVVYRFDSDIPLIPASNLKILTTSAFLDHFGADFKFHTPLLLKDGDLYLIGDGDPTMGDAELLKKVGWDVDTVFKAWAEELKKRGITSVRNVYVDDSVFDQEFLPPSWLSRYVNDRYSAQTGGVNLNANCVDFFLRPAGAGEPVAYRTNPPETRYITVRNACFGGGEDNLVSLVRTQGTNQITIRGQLRAANAEPFSIPIHDPPIFAGTVLAETQGRNGVSVTGEVVRDRTVQQRHAKDPAGWTVVAALDTKLSAVLNRANKDSMNLYAECLCKRLGHEVAGESGSWVNGTAAVGAFLKGIDVLETHFHLEDGSGLSRENTVSADAIVKVLCHNFLGKNREVFLASLAVPGEEGTFKKRFAGKLHDRVFGKSGYVNNVSALSGYLRGRDEKWYAFSILMNNLPGGTNNVAKEIQEKIVGAIDENAGK